ncbi:MAG: hypothetical protein LAT58_13325, partial [Opitutales bacterium]|nr:hypothetical protein [Opitutales bacterium]
PLPGTLLAKDEYADPPPPPAVSLSPAYSSSADGRTGPRPNSDLDFTLADHRQLPLKKSGRLLSFRIGLILQLERVFPPASKTTPPANRFLNDP